MIPDIAWVVRKRYHVRRRLLHMSLILFILAVMTTASVLVTITLALISQEDVQMYMIISSLSYFFMFVLPGALISIFHVKLVRWLVPVPKAICPRCSYALRNLVESRCPECGTKLPREMIDQPDTD